ncbi:MAG: EF2563 family selenium-dependent molybdenum hydroxylase system protein [Chloroflexi bacterium]|nr:EF2563 family selenium-dependent molybdenum hydroxylase system protein [Chloroflexota bacterium]
MLSEVLVIIKGAGDLASGVAVRLYRCGFPLMMTEIQQPTVVRRTVAFAEAIYDGDASIEGITATKTTSAAQALEVLRTGKIPVLVDPQANVVKALRPRVVVDAIIAKRNVGTTIADAPIVVALGPGFTAGVDAHAVVETNRGHNLGRVIWQGEAEPNTGVPGPVGGYATERVLRAPRDGMVRALRSIGDTVVEDDVIAWVEDQPVIAPFKGVLRGLINGHVDVTSGMKIGDVDPRAIRDHCFTVSDKALAIAGGVLEAILASLAKSHALAR